MRNMLEDKVALITGAGSGIGRAGALLFASQGARVIAADLDEGALRETRELASRDGLAIDTICADVTNEAAVKSLIEEIVQRHGQLDCAHNNVGIMGLPTGMTGTSYTDWQKVIEVNLSSTFLCMKYEIQQMLKQGGGSIVNTASGAGVVGLAALPAYTASKHGVLGLTKSAALEYVNERIRINAICPGTTNTPFLQANIAGNSEVEDYLKSTMTSNGQFGEPEQVAQAALWLCSDLSSWVSGDTMLVDGGFVCR